MTTERIKVFGERNSGTNLLIQLLQQVPQLDVLPGGSPQWLRRTLRHCPQRTREAALDRWDQHVYPQTLGWKHAFITDDTARRLHQSGTACVALVKHPLSWLVSLRLNPYHLRADGVGGLAHIKLRRERLPNPVEDIGDLWRIKHSRYVDLADRGLLQILRFEDLISDQQGAVHTLLDSLGVKHNTIQAVQRDVKGPGRSAATIADHYATEAWRSQCDSSDLLWFSTLDHRLLDRLNYLDEAADRPV